MRASLAQLHARLAVTSIYVTHDQTEAMTLGHRVAVMRDGRIVQVDVPQRLYQDPRDLFVGTFIGSPSMNLVEATLDGDHVGSGDRERAIKGRTLDRHEPCREDLCSRRRYPPQPESGGQERGRCRAQFKQDRVIDVYPESLGDCSFNDRQVSVSDPGVHPPRKLTRALIVSQLRYQCSEATPTGDGRVTARRRDFSHRYRTIKRHNLVYVVQPDQSMSLG